MKVKAVYDKPSSDHTMCHYLLVMPSSVYSEYMEGETVLYRERCQTENSAQ